MTPFQKRLIENKARLLKQFAADIDNDFGIKVKDGYGFTTSDFFYFGEIDGKKYAHKEALRFVYTNAGTFQREEPQSDVAFNATEEQKALINAEVDTIFRFFRDEINQHPLYPELLEESEHFFVFKYYRSVDGWKKLRSLTRADAKYIRQHYHPLRNDPSQVITPLYNQMAEKILRHKDTGKIKMVDLKSFEVRPNERPLVYMYNGIINDLYALGVNISSRKKLLRAFSQDYPVSQTRVQRYFF